MSRNEPAPTPPESASDEHAVDDSAATRRSVLRAGLAAGVTTSLAGVASIPAGAHGDGPEQPADLRTDWQLGGPVGLAWTYPGEPCSTHLSHFEVSVTDDDGRSETHEVPPTRRAFETSVEAPSTTVAVRAVDEHGESSEAVELDVPAMAVDYEYLLRPARAPALSAGETATVPIELRGATNGAGLVRYDLEVSVRAPCVATIEDASVPDDLGLEVVETAFADDGSSARILAEGPAPDESWDGQLLDVDLEGQAEGDTVLDVTDEEIVLLEDDWGYDDWQQYRDSPEEFPDDVGIGDLIVDAGALNRWVTVSVDGPVPPAPPENFRTDYWISDSVGLAWDWPDGLCDDALSHFHVTLRDEQRDGPLLEERTVPAERPTTVVSPPAQLQPDDVGNSLLVSVYAVDEAGRRSEPVRDRFGPAVADPGYLLQPTASPTLAPDATATVPVEFDALLAQDVGLVRYEIEVDVAAHCVATIADVAVPREEWELLETDWAADDSAVTVVAEGPPPADPSDYDDQQLLEVEIAGHSPGETVLDVRDVELLALDQDYYYEDYEYVRVANERDDVEDPELALEDVTQTVGATDTRSTVRVHPPTVVGDSPPRDVDGDGLYRDVTGDGAVTNADVTAFFRNQHTAVVDDYPDAYDFTGDDEVGQADVIELFESVGS